MTKIHFIGLDNMKDASYKQAVDFFMKNVKDENIPKMSCDCDIETYLSNNVRMGVSKRGREYYTVDVPLSNSGRG
jgi:hypothetical protein